MRKVSATYVMPLLLVGWLSMDSATDFLPEAQGTPARQLVETGRPPYSSIGKLRGEMTCSAVAAIDPRVVVTAGHCVIGEGATAVGSVAFQPSDPANAEWIGGRVVRFGHDLSPRDRTASDEAVDWAIIVLDAAPLGLRPLGLRALRSAEFKRLQGRVILPSYSADVAGGDLLSAVEHCSIREARWGVLIHDCPCADGSSGGPLVILGDEGYALVGINSAMLYPTDGDQPAKVLHAAVSASSFEAALREVIASLDGNRAQVAREAQPDNADQDPDG